MLKSQESLGSGMHVLSHGKCEVFWGLKLSILVFCCV